MTLPNLDPAQPPEQLLHDIDAYIETANASLKARDMVMLAGLDDAVDTLCQRVLALDPDVRKTYAPQLQQLMERIDQLQKNMVTMQNEVATTIRSLSNTKKASNAYNNAPTGKVEE